MINIKTGTLKSFALYAIILGFITDILAAPLEAESANINAMSNTIEVRQGALDILEVGIEIMNLIKDIVDIDKDQHAAESQYTQSMVAQLRREYPDKNVIIYHDQDSHVEFDSSAVHEHQEFDIGLGMTEGYEIYVFDSGSFTLVGDGGYLNWCLGGDFDRNGNDVTFNQISVPQAAQPPAPAPASPPIPPSSPVRENSGNTDGNYFVNCESTDGTISSGMAYYKNLNPGQNKGQQPDDYIDVLHGSHVTWEQPGAGKLPSNWSQNQYMANPYRNSNF
ncbi:hypothetical protein BP5796_09796 [Coleophoma crateriformis]|uniref:Uncharacterized protein n=1 Tax=Coleophoma crateriformis TaxID=565419 RepID=A0A3D8QZ48_9HELO|nr:hypothetical protein BP5796_09796 [Coleophoma crateriformis]